MKKQFFLFVSLMILCAAAYGCQAPEPEATAAPTLAETAIGQTTAAPEPAATNYCFKPGVWMAQGGEAGRYYFFAADGVSGRTVSYEDGGEGAFTCAWEGEKVIFTWDGPEQSLPGRVAVTDEDHVTLKWEAQFEETLTFLSPLDGEHFHFYTHEELCALALEDYLARNDSAEGLMAAAADNGDGTVTIQIYQNLGDHNSTAAWYQVDRVTGEGQNVSSGESVDLTNGTPDMAIRAWHEGEAIPDCHMWALSVSAYDTILILTPEVPVAEFTVVSLEYDGEANRFRIAEEHTTQELLTPEKPMALRLEIPGTIPHAGITYLDRNGQRQYYAISLSGYDGSPLLTQITIE